MAFEVLIRRPNLDMFNIGWHTQETVKLDNSKVLWSGYYDKIMIDGFQYQIEWRSLRPPIERGISPELQPGIVTGTDKEMGTFNLEKTTVNVEGRRYRFDLWLRDTTKDRWYQPNRELKVGEFMQVHLSNLEELNRGHARGWVSIANTFFTAAHWTRQVRLAGVKRILIEVSPQSGRKEITERIFQVKAYRDEIEVTPYSSHSLGWGKDRKGMIVFDSIVQQPDSITMFE